MSTARIRPRFEIEFDRDADAIMERLRDRLPKCPDCAGVSVGRHAELFVPETDRRLWSPWLSVTADQDGERSRLRCQFAPHPNLWTLYVFFAFGLGFAFLVGSTWGYAQWATDRTPWALASIPMVGLFGILLYLASQLGQRLSGDQMDDLRSALEDLIGEP